MRKITITGASGFVGVNVQKYLREKNYEVYGLSLRNNDWKGRLCGDTIIHLAGKAHDTSQSSDPAEYYSVNRDLTISLFQEFLSSESSVFIYFSSVKAAADSVDGVMYEGIFASPLTPYGISKLEAEKFLLAQPLPYGKRLFILRPCMIHGPENKGNLNLLYNVVRKGIPYPLGAFDNLRSFLAIDNLLFALGEMIVNPNIENGVYNIADDEALSTNELIDIIAETSGSRGRNWKISKPIINGIAKIGDRLNLPLNSERLKKLTESYVVSNEKIKKALGIDKFPVSAREGLIKTIKSFK